MRIADSPRLIRVPSGAVWLVAALAVIAGCGSGDRPLDQVDPAAASANPTYDEVYAILHRACVPCHDGGGEAPVTGGVPAPLEDDEGEDLDLTNCIDIVAQRQGIVDEIEANTMPTGAMPRLTSAEKLLIRRWVDQGAVAPCN
jgi:uncharacterized membrane protein